MNRPVGRLAAFALFLSLALFARPDCHGQELSRDKEKPAVAVDPAVIARLIEQLGSSDFKTREKASEELARLDTVPDALRDAAKDGDPEVSQRAQKVIDVITPRAGERAFQAKLREIELDVFVRRMVTDEKFRDDKQWEFVQALANAVLRKANALGSREYEIPYLDIKKLPVADLAFDRVGFDQKRLLVKDINFDIPTMFGSVMLCTGRTLRFSDGVSTGRTPRFSDGVSNSIVIVDGDFAGAKIIESSLLIVRGNVGRVDRVINSVILATGNFEGATSCENSFVQVNNYQIRFETMEGSTIVKTKVNPKTRQMLDTEKGPLQLLTFSPRKAEFWGKEVKNLAVAIVPTEQKDRFLIRWKNNGKTPLELPWMRMKTESTVGYRDDLLYHVELKGPDGKLVPARDYDGLVSRDAQRSVAGGSPPYSDRTVVLGPNQIHDEIINLWTYVDRSMAEGRCQLSIELDISKGRRGRESDVDFWSGTIRSNVLEVAFEK